MDWATLAQVANYLQGASNTRAVGALIAQVMRHLLTVEGTTSGRLWCVGHSLGSHVCGHAGMKMPTETPLGRITGRIYLQGQVRSGSHPKGLSGHGCCSDV